MTKMMPRRTAMAGLLATPMLARHGWAEQAWPAKQIRMVVPYVAAPAGTPTEIVKKLSDEVTRGIKSEAVIKKIREAGAAELPGDAEALAGHIVAENAKWKKVVQAARLEPQ